MNVQNLGLEQLKIGPDGRWSAAACWLIAADSSLSLTQNRESVRQWAGNPGDFLKVPADSGNAVRTDPAYRIQTIDIQFLDHYRAKVTLTATRTEVVPQLSQTISDTIDELNQTARHASWLVPRDQVDELKPLPGMQFSWDNQPFLCTRCSVKFLDADTAQLAIDARPAAVSQLGATNFWTDQNQINYAEALWFVPAADLDDFLSQHLLYAAATWAGTGYFLTDLQKKPSGLAGWQIGLTAKTVTDRLLHSHRNVEFARLDYNGNPRRKIVWTSLWQVTAAGLEQFYQQSAMPPANWANSHAIVTKVVPQPVSPIEYLVTMTAEDLDNPGLFERDPEDDSDLANRKDASVDMAEFFITAQMAGYNRDPDGVLQPIPDWEPSQSCPFTASGPLDIALADSCLKTFIVHESNYVSGRAGNQIGNLANWAKTRVFNGTAAGHSGNYLKIRQTCSETRDRAGNIYTRINRSYQLAPGDLRWSSQYWANH